MILTDEELALAYRAVLNQSIRPQDKSVIFKYASSTIEAAILAKLNSAESILAKDNEALRAQIAELTERLRLSEALRTSDMETTKIRAHALEMMRNELLLMKRDKWHWQEARDRALSTPPAPAPAPAPAPSAPSAPEPCVQCQSEYFRGWAEALEVAAKLCRNEAKLRLAQDILNLIER
jgi:hypothetical protein